MKPAKRTVAFEMFESHTKPWDVLFEEAARFASHLEPDELISISHSQEGIRGVVTVWYWLQK